MQISNEPSGFADKTRVKSDVFRKILLVTGMIFALAGFYRYAADMIAVLS